MKRVIIGLLLLFHPFLSAFASTCDVYEPFVIEDARMFPPLIGLKISDSPTTGPPLRDPDMVWVENSLTSMTLQEKVGQMIVTGYHSSGEYMIDNYNIGGFIFTGNNQDAANIVASVNRLQTYSDFPLWFAIDAEAGLGARVGNATIFPLIMAFGAIDDAAYTEECGRITARECRALGIQVAYGPVVDVNTESCNPIISTRSYSDDPLRVTRLARGFIKGARREGLLCTFKHYPGHGATTGDSHSSLPVVDLPLSQLEAEHIKPYRELAGTGDVDFVMTAHVWYSQVDTAKPWPATLSSIFLTDILRTSIGYDGLIISDSYGMAGLAQAVPDQKERAVVGVEAGLDIILNPPDVGLVFAGICEAVQSERLSEERINQSVRRILIAKSRVGLPENNTVDPALYPTVLQHPDHQAVVREVCEKAFTCGKNMLTSKPPVVSGDKCLILTLAPSRTIFYCFSSDYFTNPFCLQVPDTDIQYVSTYVSSSIHDQIIASAPLYDKVVIAGYDWYKILSSSQVTLINDLCALSVPVIYVGFGAPYHYVQIAGVDAFYCGYASVPAMQEVAVEVLTGQRTAVGTLPVEVEGLPKFPSFEGWIMN